MSLDISLHQSTEKTIQCINCDHTNILEIDYEVVFSANLTHNLTEMASECGLYTAIWQPDKIFIRCGEKMVADSIIMPMVYGLYKLRENPDYFKKFNPKNGWGSYDIFVEFVDSYLKACIKYPYSKIEISK